MINFGTKQMWTLFLDFSETDFGFITKTFSKKWRMTFSKAQDICFWPQNSWKIIFFKCFLWPTLGTFYLALSENGFNFINQKFEKRWKCHFSALKTYVFDLKIAGEQFSQTLLMTTFGLNSVFLALSGNSFDLATQ